MARPIPDPKAFKGKRLREFLEAISDYFLDTRIIPDEEGTIQVTEDFGGITLSTINPGSLRLIKTTGTITARSGTVPGSGNAVFVKWDGTNLSDGGNVVLKNISAKTGGIASGKYGWAAEVGGVWMVVSVEC